MGPTHHLVPNVRFRVAKSTVRVKSVFESPHCLSKNVKCGEQGGSRLWKPTPSRQKLYVLEEEGIFYFL